MLDCSLVGSICVTFQVSERWQTVELQRFASFHRNRLYYQLEFFSVHSQLKQLITVNMAYDFQWLMANILLLGSSSCATGYRVAV